MHRRTYLSTVGATGAVVLAGCSGGTDHQHGEDPWVDEERTEGRRQVEVEATAELGPGEYAVRRASPAVGVQYTIEFDVVEENAIDLFFLTRDEFRERYREGAGNELLFRQGLTAMGEVSKTLSSQVAAGEYAIVLDNTPVWGDADADGDVTVDLRVTGSV